MNSLKKDEQPLVSIAMPIYNEEKHIEKSLNSLLNQTYKNIEIIIRDNASTDSTGEIVDTFCKSYKNIKYIKLKKNTGAASNFINLIDLSGGKYFVWAAGHDLWSNDYIEESVKLLETRSDAVLCFSSVYWIDDNDEEINKFSGWCDTRGMHTVERFYSVLLGNMNPILGLIRHDTLNKIKRHSGIGMDLLILLELSLKGDFIHSIKSKFYRRELQQRSSETHSKRMRRYNSSEYNLTNSRLSKIFPLLKLPFQIFSVVFKSDTKIIDKLAISIILITFMPVKYLIGKKSI